jgi:hypothetical protein
MRGDSNGIPNSERTFSRHPAVPFRIAIHLSWPVVPVLNDATGTPNSVSNPAPIATRGLVFELPTGCPPKSSVLIDIGRTRLDSDICSEFRSRSGSLSTRRVKISAERLLCSDRTVYNPFARFKLLGLDPVSRWLKRRGAP